MKKFIAVAGNMGVGKSSMVEFLCHQYGFEPIYEPFMDNPFLDDFCSDLMRFLKVIQMQNWEEQHEKSTSQQSPDTQNRL